MMTVLKPIVLAVLTVTTTFWTTVVVASSLEGCTGYDVSVGASPTEHVCNSAPQITVDASATAVVTSGLFMRDSSSFMHTLSIPLTFSSFNLCPLIYTASDLSCVMVRNMWASSNSGTDGAFIAVNGQGVQGTINWSCMDTNSGTVQFYFYMESVANDDDSDIDADSAAFLRNTFDQPVDTPNTQNPENMDVMALQKFDNVDASTDVYYMESSEVGINILFKSAATTIKLSTSRYDQVATSTGLTNAGVTMDGASPMGECTTAYKLTFPSGDDDVDGDDDNNGGAIDIDDDGDDDNNNNNNNNGSPTKFPGFIYALAFATLMLK